MGESRVRVCGRARPTPLCAPAAYRRRAGAAPPSPRFLSRLPSRHSPCSTWSWAPGSPRHLARQQVAAWRESERESACGWGSALCEQREPGHEHSRACGGRHPETGEGDRRGLHRRSGGGSQLGPRRPGRKLSVCGRGRGSPHARAHTHTGPLNARVSRGEGGRGKHSCTLALSRPERTGPGHFWVRPAHAGPPPPSHRPGCGLVAQAPPLPWY